MNPRALAFDLDGTLAESKQRVSARMGDLLGELLKRVPVAILSGASFEQFQTQCLPSLPADATLSNLYLFPENAGQCFVYRGGWKPQYDHSFSDSETHAILTALRSALEETGLRDTPEQVWGERIENRGAQISFSPLGQAAPLAAKEKWHQEHEPVRKRLQDTLAQKLPDFFVAEGGLTTIDVTHKGVTKAYGLRRFSELTNLPLTKMLYVGDALEEGGNDAVVIDTGIPTHAVFGPEETAELIESLLAASHH